MKKLIILMNLAITVCCGALFAQKPAVVASDKTGWHKIGETTVDFARDHDEVAVLMADRFAALKFKVTDAPIDLHDLDVYFEDGSMKTVGVGFTLKAAGESSRVIDLPGSEKNLKKIVFRYKTVPNSKNQKAHVEIWGMKTNTDKDKGMKEHRDHK